MPGCAKQDPFADKPQRTPVSGVVTLDGAPLAGATIVLHPNDHQHAAIGRSNDQGQFYVETFSPKDGAVPGSYAITVIKEEAPVSRGPVNDDEPSETPAPKLLVPAGYIHRSSSGLSTTVAEGAENKLELNLTSKLKSSPVKSQAATRASSE